MVLTEQRTFNHELAMMSTMLQQAINLASSLQELHEMDLHRAAQASTAENEELLGLAQRTQGRTPPHMPASAVEDTKKKLLGGASDGSLTEQVKPEGKFTYAAGKPQDTCPTSPMTAGAHSSGTIGNIREMWENENRKPPRGFTSDMRILVEIDAMTGEETLFRERSRMNSSKAEASFFTACIQFFFGIIHPFCKMRLVWNAFIVLFICYDLIVIPAVVFDIHYVKIIGLFEWVIAIWWTVDVWISLRTGYLQGTKVELRRRKVAIHYAKTWMIVDAIIVIGEWMNCLLDKFISISWLRSVRVQRALKGFAVFRLIRAHRISHIEGVWMSLQGTLCSRGFVLIVTMLSLGMATMLTIHITACIWYGIGTANDHGWTAYDAYEGEKDVWFWYITSFRWVISQLNGRTDVNDRSPMAERFFTCFVGIVLGVYYQAVFISVITKTMLKISKLFSVQVCRQRAVSEYLEIHPLPPLLSLQVRRSHYAYKDTDSELHKEEQVLAVLSKDVKVNVLYEVRSTVLKEHHFFSVLCSKSIGVMRLVCQHVVQAIEVSIDEVIFDKGDVCDRMLFLDKLTAVYGDPSGIKCTFLKDDFKQVVLDHVGIGNFIAPSKGSLSNADLFGPWHSESSNGQGGIIDYEGQSDFKKLPPNSWISEAGLWIVWRNQGRMVSTARGALIEVQASKFAQVLSKDPAAFALTSLYAKRMATEMGKYPDELSDVLPFTVHLRFNRPEASNDSSGQDIH